jgi:hypothetical protein
MSVTIFRTADEAAAYLDAVIEDGEAEDFVKAFAAVLRSNAQNKHHAINSKMLRMLEDIVNY